jgi:hypothetical protein
MTLVLMQHYERKYADIKMIEKQLQMFSQYTGFDFYIDKRSNTIQIYDDNICQDKLTYIQQNLKMIINISSC